MQQIIVFIVIGIAVGYAGWRIYKAINDPCRGCKGCDIKKQILKNKGKTGTHARTSDRKPSCFKEKSKKNLAE